MGRTATTVSRSHQISIHLKGDCHGDAHPFHRVARAVKQGQAHRPEAATEVGGNLGDSPRLEVSSNIRELATFNLAIDSKLRACDLTRLHVQDICQGSQVGSRAIVMQQKTQRPVEFEITEQTRRSSKRGSRREG